MRCGAEGLGRRKWMGYIVVVGDSGLPLRWTVLRNWFPRSRRVTNEVERWVASAERAFILSTRQRLPEGKQADVVSNVSLSAVVGRGRYWNCLGSLQSRSRGPGVAPPGGYLATSLPSCGYLEVKLLCKYGWYFGWSRITTDRAVDDRSTDSRHPSLRDHAAPRRGSQGKVRCRCSLCSAQASCFSFPPCRSTCRQGESMVFV